MEKEFFVKQMEAHSGMLYRVAYTILHSDDACRDALQDAALKAWEKRTALRDAAAFRPWIARILVNTCYDTLKKRRRTVPMEDVPAPAAPPPDPELSWALAALNERLRLPLVLIYSEGMSYEEAAQALHLPLSTVRGRVHRAKEALRKELDAE